MKFIPGLHPPSDTKRPALWFIVDKGKLLVTAAAENCRIPDSSDVAGMGRPPLRPQYIGTQGDHFCYAAEWEEDGPIPAPFEWRDIRSLFGRIQEDLIWVAGRANQLVDWDQNHRYCGRCGRLTEDKTDERAKVCSGCGMINYPRLNPAVIVAVLKDDQILLARNKRFRGPFFSVLAGFVEPGETLEDCIRREIHEEVGIDVKNIRYFGSQPWPFPNSLMVAFVAEHAGGEIRVDRSEILEAAWFSRDGLPATPPRISIASKLIDWFRDPRT